MSRSDPYARTLWSVAHCEIMRRQDRTVHADHADVIWLRDMLVTAWEGGAKRTLAQSKAIDDALTAHAIQAIPVFVVPT